MFLHAAFEVTVCKELPLLNGNLATFTVNKYKQGNYQCLPLL